MFRSVLAIICVALLPLLSGCGEDDTISGTQPKLVFRLALELKPETKIWDASNLFQQELQKASPEHSIEAGEIQVEFYDRGMLGTERQLLEACYVGVVEVIQINTSVVTAVEPSYGVIDLPYLFESEAHHEAVLNGPIGDDLLKRLRDKRFVGLSFYCAGFRNMFYKSDAEQSDALSPEDLEGLKIRVMQSQVMIDSINALGPRATPLPFSELYQALKTGVVDGAENSAKVFVSSKYDETGCNQFSLTEHSTNQHVMIANAAWLESLPENYRARIKEVAREIVDDFNHSWDSANDEALTQMRELGVNVNRVADKQPFFDRVSKAADEFFASYPEVPRELYERIRGVGGRE